MMAWMGLSMKMARGESLRATLDLLHTHNLTMAMMTVLHIVGFDGTQTMTGLAEETGLSTSATSHLLQRLVELGLVERQDDAVDRRVRHVALTAEGTALVGHIMKLRFADLRASVDPLSAGTMALLSTAVGRAIDELAAHLGAPLPSCPLPEGSGPAPPASRQTPQASKLDTTHVNQTTNTTNTTTTKEST
jgi:DNA-binding MarR family transcriptional regulator